MEFDFQWKVLTGLGELFEARAVILDLGTELFGPPSPRVRQRIELYPDIDQLRRMRLRLLKVSSWQALLRTK